MLRAFAAFLILTALIAVSCFLNSHFWRKTLRHFRNPRRIYIISMFPGTMVHELCHIFMSLALLVPVRRVHLYNPLSASDGNENLGQVETTGAGPIRMGLISFAPFIGGLAGMFCLLYFMGGVSISIHSLHELPKALSGFGATPWVIPLLVLCWVLALAILPSKTDIKNALLFTLLFVGAVTFLFYTFLHFKSLEAKVTIAQGLLNIDGYLLVLLVFLLATSSLLWLSSGIRQRRPNLELPFAPKGHRS